MSFIYTSPKNHVNLHLDIPNNKVSLNLGVLNNWLLTAYMSGCCAPPNRVQFYRLGHQNEGQFGCQENAYREKYTQDNIR